MKSRKYYKEKIQPFCFPCCCLSLSPGQPGKINKRKPGTHRGREAGEVRAFLFEDHGLYAERAGYRFIRG